MRQIIALAALVIATSSFAASSDSSSLDALSSAWKAQSSNLIRKNELAMVYGGADLSHKPTIIEHTIAA